MSALKLSRRALLLGGGAGLLRGGAAATPAPPVPRFRGRIGVASSSASDEPAAVAASLSRALIRAVPGADSAAMAASLLFSPQDVVGIKLNCLAGSHLSPRLELVEALAALLSKRGVPPTNIIVFERASAELERAGFRVQRSEGDFRCYGIDNDYDAEPTESGQIGSCYARLVSTTCTALVSVGVVKDHDLAGVSGGLKNWYGVIHNPNKYHDNNCDPYVVDVVRHPFIRSKLQLTLLDGATAQCQGGPAFFASGSFALGKLAASTDPVAMDLWAWQAIEAEREKRGLPTLTAEQRAPSYLHTASEYGLGCACSEELEVRGS